MEGEIDIRRYIRAFLRRKWGFVGILFGILGLTYWMTARSPKVFVASSKVLIKKTPSTVYIFPTRLSEEVFEIETNCWILRSHDFMKRVVNKMKEKGLKFAFLSNEYAPDILCRMTTITRVEKSSIIEITVRGGNAEEISSIANNIAETFKDYSVEIARLSFTEAKRLIETQLPIAKDKLRESEEAIKKFKQNEKLLSASAGSSALQKELADLEGEYNLVLSEISIKDKAIAQLRDELKKETDKLTEEIVRTDNPSILNLRAQLVSLEKEYSSYVLAGLSEDHPKLSDLKEKIETIKQSLKERVKNRTEDEALLVDPLSYSEDLSKKILSTKSELLTLQAKKEALLERISECNHRIRIFSTKEYELAGLERTYEFNKDSYKRLITDYEASKMVEAQEIGSAIILEYARKPTTPISPRPKRNLTLALIFGIGLGFGVVLICEFLDVSIKDVEDIERLKLPVIGTIPVHSEGVIEDQNLPVAESYKKLRVNLKFSKSLDSELKTILIASCIAREGKSTIACNFGITYASAGAKTLLLEADLRKPELHRLLGISHKNGLSNLLVGEIKKEDAIIATEIKNLWLIPSGHIPPNPGELIDSKSMRTSISELREAFDIVIVDSPPLTACADGLLLGNMVDGVILVAELERTPKDTLQEMVASFKATGSTFLGVVVNKLKKEIYYRSRYYYKYYTSKAV
ncbi:MAG: polysaccharide biosynthesis tyrosine autokinase [bacterium]|nr:polysaccharide biosynthesis tyrosine autokinase [bacterium]